MHPDAKLDPTLASLIETLVDAADANLRDRILVQAAMRFGSASAAALFRVTAGNEIPDPTWHLVVYRGELEFLPSEQEVRAISNGELPVAFVPGSLVLFGGEGSSRRALALGGVLDADEKADLFESLLVMLGILEEGESTLTPLPRAPVLLDRVLPPFPSRRGRETTSHGRVEHDLRNLLSCIRTTQELLAQFGDGLTEDEHQGFSEALERECLRAGDLIIGALDREAPDAHRNEGGRAPDSRIVRDAAVAEQAALRRGKIELQLDIDEAVEGLASALSELDLARVVHDLVADACQAFAGREGPRTLRVLLGLERRTSRTGIALVVESDGSPGPEPHAGAGLRNGPGSGHGFAIVRSLVEGVSGEVQVGSGSQGDALFRVWIPLARKSA